MPLLPSQPSSELSSKLVELQQKVARTINELYTTSLELDECEIIIRLLQELSNGTLPLVHEFNRRRRLSHENRDSRILGDLNRIDSCLDKLSVGQKKPRFRARQISKPTRKAKKVDHTPPISETLIHCQQRIKAILFEAVDLARMFNHQIEICDFFAQEWSLPLDLCINRDAFLSVLATKYKNGPAEDIIKANRMGILRRDDLQLVKPTDWEALIMKREGLQLSVIIIAQQETAMGPKCCPRCGFSRYQTTDHDSAWVDCPRCDSSFNTIPSEENENGVHEVYTPENQHNISQSRRQELTFKFYSTISPSVAPLMSPPPELNRAYTSISPMIARQIQKELNLDEKDVNSLTPAEKQRIVTLYRLRHPPGPGGSGGSQALQMSVSEIKQAYASIAPMIAQQIQKVLNMDGKDFNSLTPAEMQRIIGLYLSMHPPGPSGPGGSQALQMSIPELNQAYASIAPMIAQQIQKVLNMDGKDGNLLTPAEKQRIITLYRSMHPPSPGGPGGSQALQMSIPELNQAYTSIAPMIAQHMQRELSMDPRKDVYSLTPLEKQRILALYRSRHPPNEMNPIRGPMLIPLQRVQQPLQR